MVVMGLDEAGRGSVLGPMVVGAFAVDVERTPQVKAAGATDSKKLSRKRREGMIDALAALGTGEVREISAVAIVGGNLNQLEERVFAELIRAHRPEVVIIDAPCHPAGIPAFKTRLRAQLDHAPKLIVEPKADLNHVPCGAASIFAKVHRDRCIDALGALGTVGSGYPSDPKTRAWLSGLFERGEPWPACVRTRWGTVRDLSKGRTP